MKGSDKYIIGQLLDLATQVGRQLAFVASVDHGEKGERAYAALRLINTGLGMVRERISADADFTELAPLIHLLGKQLLANVNGDKDLRDRVVSYHAFLNDHAPLPDRPGPSNGTAAITASMKSLSNEIARRQAVERSLESRREENEKTGRKLTRAYYERVMDLCVKVVEAISDESRKEKTKRFLSGDEHLVNEFSDAVLELPSEYDPNFRLAYVDYVVTLINALVPEGHVLKKEAELALHGKSSKAGQQRVEAAKKSPGKPGSRPGSKPSKRNGCRPAPH